MYRAIALLFLVVAWPSVAQAQSLATGSAPDIPWFRLLLSLAFCIAVAWGAVRLLKYYQRRGIANPIKSLLERQGAASQRRIAIIETRRASLHADLCLVECDGDTYLLALTPAGATVLRHDSEKASA